MDPLKKAPGSVGRIGSGEDTDCICYKCLQIKLKIYCVEVKARPGAKLQHMCLACLKKNEGESSEMLFRSGIQDQTGSGQKRPV